MLAGVSSGEYNRSSAGGMAEWLKAAVLKTAFRFPERGFESLSLRQLGNEAIGLPSARDRQPFLKKFQAVGENIKKVRMKVGLTQDDLVRNSGVKHTTLTKIERDVVVKPSVQPVAKIAKPLGVPMEELVK
jgi:DNA-binding XRE family transcriptional regulator